MKPITLLLAALMFPVCARADWPQWRGPQRTGHVPADATVPAKLPDVAQVAWKEPVQFGLDSPVVSGGRVIYLDIQQGKETVHARDAATGRLLWSAELFAAFKDTQSESGPRCTATLDGDRVYAQSCQGELRCLSAADGKVIWRTNYVTDFAATFIGEMGNATGAVRHGYCGSPLVDGDRLYATVGGKGASLVCFDKLTGKVIWKSQDDAPGYSGPFIATIGGQRQVLYYTADAILGLGVDGGALLWRHPIRTGFGRHVTTPIVAGDLVVVSSHQAGLMAIRISKADGTWKAAPAWTSRQNAINFASPVLVDKHLYGIGPRGDLICVDVETGKQAWSKDGLTGGPGRAYAGMLVMGKRILALTDTGQLLLIEADPTEYREVGRLQACGKNWCIPAYSDGLLFVRDAKELRCLRLP